MCMRGEAPAARCRAGRCPWVQQTLSPRGSRARLQTDRRRGLPLGRRVSPGRAPERGTIPLVDDWKDLRGRLLGILIRLEDRLAPSQVVFIHELIDVGEWGVALEAIADVLAEDEVEIHDDEREDLLMLNGRLGMGERVPHALSFCPPRS